MCLRPCSWISNGCTWILQKKYLFEVSEIECLVEGDGPKQLSFLGAVCSASGDISPLRSRACDPCSHYIDFEGGSKPPGEPQLHLVGCGVRDGQIPPFGELALVKQQRGHSYRHRGHLREGQNGMQK